MILIKDITKHRPKASAEIRVKNFGVWDYKVIDEKLRLIWEPVEGSSDYERVTWDELEMFIEDMGLKKGTEVVSETGNEELNSIEVTPDYVNFEE